MTTRTQQLQEVVNATAPGSKLADELTNRKARGTGGNLERFIKTMHSKYVAQPKAAECKPAVADAVAKLQDSLISAIKSAFVGFQG